jgi:CheY-like chemotaxis protein
VREPFFTTRAIGEGAGLGLAMCEGILQSFGGSMAIESRPGRTVVRLTLAAAAAALPATPAESDRKLAILIVDDEEAVARALKRILKSHAVTFAAGGRQALDLLEADRGFDLIFCDLMMPELTGMDVFERLQASNRPLAERVVFMTGGTFTERARKFRESVPNVFLEKPFDVQLIRGLLQKYR